MTEAVKDKLAAEAKTSEKPWVKHMGKLKHLRKETERVNRLIEEESEEVDLQARRRQSMQAVVGLWENRKKQFDSQTYIRRLRK